MSSLPLPCTGHPIGASVRRRGGGAASRPSPLLLRHRQQQQQQRHVVGSSTTSSSSSSTSGNSSSACRRRRVPPLPLPPPPIAPSRAVDDGDQRRCRRRRRPFLPAAAANAGSASSGEPDDNQNPKPDQPPTAQFSFSLPPLPRPSWPPGAVGRVMALWLLAYLFLGRVFVPLLAALGLPLQAHPSAGAGGGGVALAHLALDAAQLGCTCLILRLSLGEPWRALRSKGLFSFGWRNAREWIPAVLIGCLAFPIVGWAARWAAAVGLDAAASAPPLPIEGDAVGAGGSLVLEAGAAAAAAPGGGGAAAAAALGYALVVAVCAPLWEEAVFRGFLLPSVAAYGPFFGGGGGDGKAAAEEQRGQSSTTATAASLRAVVLSAAAFAGCHFRADTALPMFLLGLLFGGACVATRGRLAAPVALHGLWNLWAVAHSAVAA